MDTDPPATFPLAPSSPHPSPPTDPGFFGLDPADDAADESVPDGPYDGDGSVAAPPPPDRPATSPADRVVPTGAVVPGSAAVPGVARTILAALHRFGLPPEATALLAVAASALAASALAMNHSGFGGLFALVGIGLAWLSALALTLRPGRYAPGAPHGFVEAMQPCAGALVLGGLVLDAAQRGGPFAQLVTLALLIFEMWSYALATNGPRRTLLLGSPERLAALALCCILGHPLFGAFAVLVLTAFEVAMPIVRLWPGGTPLGPRLLTAFGGSQGRLPTWARWTAFAVPVLLALVLPAEFGRRF